ncbi:MAG: glucosamine-6-phosphate deaminase [Cyclobacteriaceae bacterium]|nr:glucosamine-6-phosphate deaminase [Cyclobacteriaceae bacterium]
MLEYTEQSFEKIPVEVFDEPADASKRVARVISDLIRDKQSKGEMAVLGLATGSTPKQIYAELVRMHREEGLSFQNVITFNLDEYYPMQPDSLQSYVLFMKQQLFNHIDIKPENVNIPDGTLPIEKVKHYCDDYERKIEAAGGLDIQILGIGRSGHIGFNEPGSTLQSKTRLVKLDPITITDAVNDFIKEEFVPLRAITMGISTILKAKQIFLMAWSEGKAKVIQKAVEEDPSEEVPASFLQQHQNVIIYLDKWSASELSRFKTPWLVGHCSWDDALTKKAVIWLSKKLNKPILKLTDDDYKSNDLADLLIYAGSSYDLNIKVFTSIQRTITGWPGGKPSSDDKDRPERSSPPRKRSIIFSPHPDDDVISMGGTLLRLVDQGHDVHVAYQTSGNIAVFDDDALRFADFAADFSERMGIASDEFRKIRNEAFEFIKAKKLGERDTQAVREIKGLIRKGEASAAARYCGIKEENVHFMNLPFYETGQVKKMPVGEQDIKLVMELLQSIKPHQIFAAGDLRDPHGTHRVCLDAVFAAIERLKAQGEDWLKDCYVWLYRGAWHEWEIEEIEMAVPISPAELLRKRMAIFKHQSQKDSPVFPGNDNREFWQRAEDRNHETARLYDQLGLTEYEAIEAFVRYKF